MTTIPKTGPPRYEPIRAMRKCRACEGAGGRVVQGKCLVCKVCGGAKYVEMVTAK